MPSKLIPDTEACKTCKVGSCCYEGVELTTQEFQRIKRYDPDVPKPWFRLLEKHEKTEEDYPFSTILRNGTCVFQDKDNRCRVYKVRPKFCRDFPYEGKHAAPHYKRLCVLFHDQWKPQGSISKIYRKREKM